VGTEAASGDHAGGGSEVEWRVERRLRGTVPKEQSGEGTADEESHGGDAGSPSWSPEPPLILKGSIPIWKLINIIREAP
jgi:hypothetical protein